MLELKPETLQLWAREAQDFGLSDERAVVIAKFIGDIAKLATAASLAVHFDAEPADFLHSLQRWRTGSHGSR